MMKLTKRVLGMSPSLPRRLFDMAKEIGGDVIDLTLGDPDVPPPENVRAAACAAIDACHTRYSQNAGLQQAREAVAAYQRTRYGRDVTADDVILTVGAMGSIRFLKLQNYVSVDAYDRSKIEIEFDEKDPLELFPDTYMAMRIPANASFSIQFIFEA